MHCWHGRFHLQIFKLKEFDLKASKRIDFIIVGLGLAGACLALQLRKRDKSVVVFDLPTNNSASAIAAGIFNPITGKRIAKTWMADELFPYLTTFYKEIEANSGKRLFYPSDLYIPFRSVVEQNDWAVKSADDSFSNYIKSIHTHSVFGDEVNDPLGGIILSQCGHIDTRVFISVTRDLLKNSDSYRQERFDESNMRVTDQGITYKELEAHKIIYCNGIELVAGRYFSWLPIVPLKGEVLTIQTPVNLNRIYNRGVYILKSEDHCYKVGATYDLKNNLEGITQSGRIELEAKLSDLLAIPYEVTHQDWGIRPSTRDRRLIFGEHPKERNILLFNGLGTKGVSLAPYFSDQLADYIIGAGDLNREANITRVKSLYSGL